MSTNIYNWRAKFTHEGLTPSLRVELREILTPRVRLNPPFRWEENVSPERDPDRVQDFVSWEVILNSDHVLPVLRELSKDARWEDGVHTVLSDATMLLRDALDLMKELDGANDRYDPSYSAQPSISRHSQNRDFNDWTALIELAWDAWMAMAAKFPEVAKLEAEHWFLLPYPVFKRLAFFAAAETSTISASRALEWLLADECWWLWSTVAQREAMRLLVALPPRLTSVELEKLQNLILVGPSRDMFRDDVPRERVDRLSSHEIWLRLSKVRSSGVLLSPSAADRLAGLSKQYPEWHQHPKTDDRDEFPIWMGTGDEFATLQASPKQRDALERFLEQPEPSDAWHNDDWRNRCLNDFPRAATALLSLGLKGRWPSLRWREALQAWSSSEAHVKPSWRFLSGLLSRVPDHVVKEISNALAWWLHTIGKQADVQETVFFELVHKILAVHRDENYEQDDDIVFRAINHPIGLVTEGAIRRWYRSKLQDDQKLEGPVAVLFTELCNPRIEIFRYGRVQLAIHIIALFRVDPPWTREFMLTLFDWKLSSVEACAMWKGYLVSPRLFRPFVEEIRQPLLDTVLHYSELGDLGRQYASLLTLAALELHDVFSQSELSNATASLPDDGLAVAAHTLAQALTGAATQRAEYWRNRIMPYLKRIWPKSRDRLSPRIAGHFAHLCVAAGDAFPEAVRELRDWYRAPVDPFYIVHELHTEHATENYPEDALILLDAVVTESSDWSPPDLRQCLNDIAVARPTLRDDARFQRLELFDRRKGLV